MFMSELKFLEQVLAERLNKNILLFNFVARKIKTYGRDY